MKPFNSIYTAFLLVLVAGACKVSKDIPKPLDAAPAQFRNSSSADSTTIGSLPYQDSLRKKLSVT
jgi:multidrug efflux system outer membrane protein